MYVFLASVYLKQKENVIGHLCMLVWRLEMEGD